MFLTKLRSRHELEQQAAPHDGQQMTDDQRARTAQAIINAGKKRRGELPYEDAEANIGPEAKAILDAGRRRRNEIEEE